MIDTGVRVYISRDLRSKLFDTLDSKLLNFIRGRCRYVGSEDANQHAYGFKNWFDWCVANWGTKWDIADAFIGDQTPDHISITFDTAWSPPIAVYRQLEALGFEVDATYYEPGMAFVGRYTAGDDEYYEYGSETADTVREFIGADLDDAYDISASMREWEEEQQ